MCAFKPDFITTDRELGY